MSAQQVFPPVGSRVTLRTSCSSIVSVQPVPRKKGAAATDVEASKPTKPQAGSVMELLDADSLGGRQASVFLVGSWTGRKKEWKNQTRTTLFLQQTHKGDPYGFMKAPAPRKTAPKDDQSKSPPGLRTGNGGAVSSSNPLAMSDSPLRPSLTPSKLSTGFAPQT
jgi:hypothetical protein